MPDWLFWTIGSIIGLGGLTLLAWALLWDRSRTRRRCPKCWYNMTGLPGLQCPECGKTAAAESKFFKTRRRWRWVILACALLIAGGGVAGTPKIKRDGPFALVPTPMLNFAASFFDDYAEQWYKANFGSTSFQSPNRNLEPWERVLCARYCGIRLAAMLEGTDGPGDNDYSYFAMAASFAKSEIRLVYSEIVPVLKSRNVPIDTNVDFVLLFLSDAGSNQDVAEFVAERILRCLDESRDAPAFGFRTLAANDPTGGVAIPILKRAARTCPLARDRGHAVVALSRFVEVDNDALQVVIDALDDTNGWILHGCLVAADQVRDHAIWALGDAGAAAAPAIPRLEQLAMSHPELQDSINGAIATIRADVETGN